MSGRRWLWSILADRRMLRGAVPWFAVLLLAVNSYVARARHGWEQARTANLLAPAASNPTSAPGPARFDRSVGEDVAAAWSSIPDATKQPLVVVSGMSQMYAINDAVPGDETIVEHLDDALRDRGVRAFGLAAPNLNNEEALLYLVATLAAPETRPTAFVYGVCFDKLRNVDVRPGLLRLLATRPDVRERWRALCDGRAARYPQACAKMQTTLRAATDRSQAGTSRDESFEGRLRERLGRIVPMIGAREALNARLQYRLYVLRNWVFRIEAASKRPMIASRYSLNRELLGLMAEAAQARGTTLVLYVVPLNPVAENPYVPAEYRAFKEWLAAFAAERQIPFANLEGIVPRADWGLSNGEPDYKHFRAAGHRRVAAALARPLGAAFGAPRGRNAGP